MLPLSGCLAVQYRDFIDNRAVAAGQVASNQKWLRFFLDF